MPDTYANLARHLAKHKAIPKADALKLGPLDYVKNARPTLKVRSLELDDTLEGSYKKVTLRLSRRYTNGREAGILLHFPSADNPVETMAGLLFGSYRFAEGIVPRKDVPQLKMDGFAGLMLAKEGVGSFKALREEQTFMLLPKEKRAA